MIDYSLIDVEEIKSDWDYFPDIDDSEKPEILRIVGRLNDEMITYVDYFVKDETIYLLFAWTKEEYRRMGIMQYLGQKLYDDKSDKTKYNIKNLIYVDANEVAKHIYDFDIKRFDEGRMFIYDNHESPEFFYKDDNQ